MKSPFTRQFRYNTAPPNSCYCGHQTPLRPINSQDPAMSIMIAPIDYRPFMETLQAYDLEQWTHQLTEQIDHYLTPQRFGDLKRWLAALNELPSVEATESDLNASAITLTSEQYRSELDETLRSSLQKLHPWRKGPFNLFGTEIDTEWRSDWKWDRLLPHISPLEGRKVLDVGCGSGYHCWRMRGAGAELVVGIDPGPLFICQFFALQHFIQDHHVGVLPLKSEELPAKLNCFDTVFSMGVLYHRRSPFDHLLELRDALRSGGELVLETLVIDGGNGEVLVPEDRYARMGNVWFIPSAETLVNWLQKVGFKQVRIADINQTSIEEQRTTDWMTFHSLQNFLDPEDPNKTLEGYPAPKRAILIAEAP